MKKTGLEAFQKDDQEMDLKLLEFWQWSQSDLLSNTLRGTLAEFLVARAVKAVNPVRVEWDAYDLITEEGIKIEVKSAAYIQSWVQKKDSVISYGIHEALGWDASTATYLAEYGRSADVYVFCLLKEKNRETIDPMNLNQWEFFILSTEQLNREKGKQKTIALNSLLKMNPLCTDYDGLYDGVREVWGRIGKA
ncbi:hypothetical protein [Planococcus plakortidis]|uniref:hypothetical protein n=1 Tax=Planococcus plakortidis TaxID=1038856 RepID=UPI00385B3A34